MQDAIQDLAEKERRGGEQLVPSPVLNTNRSPGLTVIGQTPPSISQSTQNTHRAQCCGRPVTNDVQGGKMNLAIAGAGVAGVYLAALLEARGVDLDLYDPEAHGTDCGISPCGWGVPSRISPHLDAVGLSLDDYALAPMKTLLVEGLRVRTPLLTVDKPRLVRDLARSVRVRRQSFGPELAQEYDLVVDATGFARALLPPCRSDLVLDTLQCRVTSGAGETSPLEPTIEGHLVSGFGYTWVFPLGKGRYHVGACTVGPADLEGLVEHALRRLTGQVHLAHHCACRSAVRVSSPYCATPFYAASVAENGTPRLVIGVGESIGTVGPFTGEGILPSMECARLLAESLDDPQGYTRAVLARFRWMMRERETLDRLRAPGGAANLGLRDRWRFYLNARRSGIRLPLAEAVRRTGRLSHWVEGPGR